jgi:hypothetical protein
VVPVPAACGREARPGQHVGDDGLLPGGDAGADLQHLDLDGPGNGDDAVGVAEEQVARATCTPATETGRPTSETSTRSLPVRMNRPRL